MIKTVAELKREAKNYTWELYYNSFMNKVDPFSLPDRIKGERVIAKVQTNSIAFKMPDGRESWLDWPKASQIRFDHAQDNNEDTILNVQVDENGLTLGELRYRLRPIKQ